MIQAITVTNPKNESLRMVLNKPELCGIAIKSIDGLGPPKSKINYQELATIDGGLYTSSRAEARNIVFELMPLDIPVSVEDNRRKTYRYFPLKKKVKVMVETDFRVLQCEGYVESNDPDIFSNEETISITVVCPDPWFYSTGDSSTVFSGVEAMFEFPFSNESLTENLIEFGNIQIDTNAKLDYDGDIDTGVYITIHVLDSAEDITLQNVQTREYMKVNTSVIQTLTGHPLQPLDDIEISTVPGNRYIRLLRNGTYTNVISALDRNSEWLMISAGMNIFTFTARNGAEKLYVSFTYRNTYGGI